MSVSAVTLNVGGTITVTATAAYSDGTTSNVSATWGSNNTSVASVSATGVVTALGVGTATVTAMLEGQTASVVVTVEALGGASEGAATAPWRGAY